MQLGFFFCIVLSVSAVCVCVRLIVRRQAAVRCEVVVVVGSVVAMCEVFGFASVPCVCVAVAGYRKES